MSKFDITWITAGVSIVGSYLNIKKKTVCFYLWGVVVVVHLIVDIQNSQYGRAFLDMFLIGTNIYGIVSWTKKEVKNSKQ